MNVHEVGLSGNNNLVFQPKMRQGRNYYRVPEETISKEGLVEMMEVVTKAMSKAELISKAVNKLDELCYPMPCESPPCEPVQVCQ